ncbi:MAG: hypothetical protein AAF290_16100 [Pseudomonadota bacterium]
MTAASQKLRSTLPLRHATDSELLALIRIGGADIDPSAWLAAFGGIAALLRAEPLALLGEPGMHSRTVDQLKALQEIARRRLPIVDTHIN